jgi:hypothetical protein
MKKGLTFTKPNDKNEREPVGDTVGPDVGAQP